MFGVHNESLNIWTHLLGALLAVMLMSWMLLAPHTTPLIQQRFTRDGVTAAVMVRFTAPC